MSPAPRSRKIPKAPHEKGDNIVILYSIIAAILLVIYVKYLI